MTHEEQVQQAHELFRRFVRVMLEHFATGWGDQGLSLPQIKLLIVLARAGPVSINQIAERLQSSQSAASLLVDRLVQARLAERTDDPADRRRAIVCLTEKGEALMGRKRRGQEMLYIWLSGLDETRLTAVIETFTALMNFANGGDAVADGSRN